MVSFGALLHGRGLLGSGTLWCTAALLFGVVRWAVVSLTRLPHSMGAVGCGMLQHNNTLQRRSGQCDPSYDCSHAVSTLLHQSSGWWKSISTLPHCWGQWAVGSLNTLLHRWGHWGVEMR